MNNLQKFFIIFILLIAISCSKDSDAPPTPDVAVLTIASISPSTGPKNTSVTITGTGLSTTAGNNDVTINGKLCSVSNSTSTQLTITIPPSAGSGKIKVIVGDTNAESSNFEFVVTATVTTIAGNNSGSEDGQGTNAQFSFPNGITFDSLGNLLIVDEGNKRIRKMTTTGLVTTIAGSSRGFVNGQGILSKFDGVSDIAVNEVGNMFVTDRLNHRIRGISLTGLVSTFSGSLVGFNDGQIANAKFNEPAGIAVDAQVNLFITDSENDKIRKISASGLVSTIAGNSNGFADGQGASAKFNNPIGIVVDVAGNTFVADRNNHRIRKITSNGVVTTIAGSTNGFSDGQGSDAKFKFPQGLAIDAFGNLFVSDTGNNKIRKISPTGLVTTIAGSISGFADGNGKIAQFNSQKRIAIDSQGNLFVSDTGNHKIRKITFD